MVGKDRTLEDFEILELGNWEISFQVETPTIRKFPNFPIRNSKMLVTLPYKPASLSG